MMNANPPFNSLTSKSPNFRPQNLGEKNQKKFNLNPSCKKPTKAIKVLTLSYPLQKVASSKSLLAKKIIKMEEGRKKRALIVDDDPLIRRVEGMLLSGFGLETKAVENGKEAVDLFVAGNTYDLVIMDMEMPVMDGPEVEISFKAAFTLMATRALRAMGVSCMIVGVTACGDEAKKAAFVAAGLDSCWDKPLNARIVDELAKKLI